MVKLGNNFFFGFVVRMKKMRFYAGFKIFIVAKIHKKAVGTNIVLTNLFGLHFLDAFTHLDKIL